MPKSRKIFLSQAGELAHRLALQVGQNGLVENFVERYAAEFDRRGLVDNPVRHRELLATLGREALLAMVAQTFAELPRYLTRRRSAVLRGEEVQLADAFREELLAALGRTQGWGAADVEDFRRDLALYQQLTARTARVKTRRSAADPVEGPFTDRCALLLDPSMLESARNAAARLLTELEAATERTLARTLRRRS